jgi:hypothetical protein
MGESRWAETARPFASPATGEQGSRRSASIAAPTARAGSTSPGEWCRISCVRDRHWRQRPGFPCSGSAGAR